MTIRLAEERDAEQVAEIWWTSGLDQMPGPEDIVVMVSEEDGVVNAFCAFAMDGKRCVGLGVASRKPGAATILMHEAFVKARELGATWVIGAVRGRNIQWHKRLGYRVAGYVKPYFLDGAPAWMMVRDL